jgi:2-hydroxy-6-oxonona-2,4-dienedioate hydrolase
MGSAAVFESTWTQVDRFRMHAMWSVEPQVPSAPRLVLLHGMAVSHRYMMPTARRLALRFPVWVPDLPGFGRSEHPRRAVSVPRLADWLAAWIRVRSLGPVVLVANSFGCQVAAAFAGRHPRLLSRLVLTAPTTDPRARTIPRLLGRWARTGLREPLWLWPLNMLGAWESGRMNVRVSLREALGDPIELRLPCVRVPTLVVGGGRDVISPSDWVREVASLLPSGQFVTLPAGAHALSADAPRSLADVVAAFAEQAPVESLA